MSKDLDAVDESLTIVLEAFTEAAERASRAMKFLIANGIKPHAGHNEIAFAWAKGELDNDAFLLLARIISWQEGEGDGPR
jgi:hypothetical protein